MSDDPALHEDDGRGRRAERPSEIPPPGWRDIALRAWNGFLGDNLAMVARSIAFSAVLALFPGLAAFVSLYGLFADPLAAARQMALLAGVMPDQTLELLRSELMRIASSAETTLSITFAVGLATALWSVSTGVKALIRGLNIAYSEPERRSFIRLSLVSLAFTAGGLVYLLIAALAVVATPLALALVRAPVDIQALALLRWPALFVLVLPALAAAYRFGPCRAQAKWRWLSWGGVLASALWIAVSLGFTWYVGAFADFSATYGSLGAMFGFLIWTWLTAVIILLGAKLNAEIEHQTAVDTTTGPARPMGERGARMADTLGEPQAIPLVSRLQRAVAARRGR